MTPTNNANDQTTDGAPFKKMTSQNQSTDEDYDEKK